MCSPTCDQAAGSPPRAASVRPGWMLPANLYLGYAMRRYTTTTEGFDRPWRLLEALLPDLRVEPLLLGGAYVASGTSSQDG